MRKALHELFASRWTRVDPWIPKRCVAHKADVKQSDVCDCKIWCKFSQQTQKGSKSVTL